MPKILHVLSIKPVGGVGTFLKNTLDFSGEFTFDIIESASDDSGTFNLSMKEKGARVFLFPSFGVSKLVSYWRACKTFYSEYGSDYQVVHVHSPVVALPHLYYAKRYGVPVRIYHSHNMRYSSTKLGTTRNKLYLNLGLRYANYLLACGQKAGDNILGQRDYHIVPNGLDTKLFAFSSKNRESMRKEYGVAGKTVVGIVGSLIAPKNHDFLLQVAEQLKNHENIVFYIIGDGALRPHLEQVVSDKKLSNLVFLGRQENILDFYPMMDILAIPSLYEGFPLVAVEAQANGIPVLIADHLDPSICILENSHRLPIKGEMAIHDWCRSIEEFDTAEDNRNLAYQIVAEKGFDSADTRQALSQLYQSFIREEIGVLE